MNLDEIIAHKKLEVAERKQRVPLKELQRSLATRQIIPRDFATAIARKPGDKIKLIAEIKKASPSAGIIRADFDPNQIAEIYQNSGANAISILTDEKFFSGKLEYLAEVKPKVSLPLLRKDFIIDEYQIYESAIAGADAILLIVAALDDTQLRDFAQLAQKEVGLYALVEVHNQQELDRALKIEPEILGINNRDLQTFRVDLETTERLVKEIPKDCIIVSESGLKTRDDVLRMQSIGVDALLIGETLMKSQNISMKIKELYNNP
ncbi:MAG: indole-3-glycerol phosphate synthase TrpC [bacterium]|nr:indole-3-glycerol phosphate synthase TrpC [bacterium]